MKYFARQAVETMLRDNMPDALVQASYAIREKKTIYSLLAFALVNFCRIKFIRRVVQKSIIAVYPNSAKKHITK